ncbi:hypothetical protein GUJ93_ZPchr0006g45770 [Zizania palustris]|uniref:Uncharacterized protein n=1 Tax=Zizania palustris TaxID=103762 RepID=A0A8J5SDX2_ZIZPA|nr:hypothetical protein GUJ93_ZPchr0006g45770 [Zizania palustris]
MASYGGDDDAGGHRSRPSQHRPSGGVGGGELASSAKLVAEAAKSVFQDHSLEKVDKGRVAGAAADLLHAASQYGKLEGKPAGSYLEKAEGYLHQYGRKEGAGGSGGKQHQGEDGEGKYQKKPGGHGAGRYEEEDEYKKKPSGGRYEEEDEYRKKPTSGGGGGYGGGRYEEEDEYRKKPSGGGHGGGRYDDEYKKPGGGHGGGRYEEEAEYGKPSGGYGYGASSGGGHGGGRYGKEEEEEKKKKHGGRHESGKDESEGGIGDYLKLAQGFMKKQGGEGGSGGGGGGGGMGDYMKLAEGFLKKR